MNEAVKPNKLRSTHQKLVEEFLVGAGHKLPSKPTVAPDDKLLLQAKLCAEELWEYFEAAGIDISIDVPAQQDGERYDVGYTDLLFTKRKTQPDLEGIADAWGDVIVIATGGLSMCGIADVPLLEEIDFNNLDKIERGTVDSNGKLIKPPDHQPPDITTVLVEQGWELPKDNDD